MSNPMKYILLILFSLQLLQASTEGQSLKCIAEASKVLGVDTKILVSKSRSSDLLIHLKEGHTQIVPLVNDFFDRALESRIGFKMAYSMRSFTLEFTSYENSKANTLDVTLVFDEDGELKTVYSQLRYLIYDFEPDPINGMEGACPPVELPPPHKNRLGVNPNDNKNAYHEIPPIIPD
jgi:hypothetical protein